MNIGLCVLFDLFTMKLFVYTLSSYELANQQAQELLKGCDPDLITDQGEQISADNGKRQRVIIFGLQLLMVQEAEIGNAVLPVEV